MKGSLLTVENSLFGFRSAYKSPMSNNVMIPGWSRTAPSTIFMLLSSEKEQIAKNKMT
ncbi:hypothetical protein D9M71_701400 [compost metagenome]